MNDAAERESRGWAGWAQVGLLVLAVAAGIYFARAPTLPRWARTRSAPPRRRPCEYCGRCWAPIR